MMQEYTAGKAMRRYYATGEIPKTAPGKALRTAVMVKLPTDSRGRAYLAVNIGKNEPISKAIALAVEHFHEIQACYPSLIELDSHHYESFGLHFRRFYPDKDSNGIPIVQAPRDRCAVICLGEARRH